MFLFHANYTVCLFQTIHRQCTDIHLHGTLIHKIKTFPSKLFFFLKHALFSLKSEFKMYLELHLLSMFVFFKNTTNKQTKKTQNKQKIKQINKNPNITASLTRRIHFKIFLHLKARYILSKNCSN
jgi:hypothetical protein